MQTAKGDHLAQPAEASVRAGRDSRSQPPSLLLMHYAALLTGLGTLLLGPLLPLLAAQWHLSDARTGLLLASQFCGSFVGGFTTYSGLRACFAQGLWAAVCGFLLFALSPGLPLACAGLALGGFGVGRVITANNIMAGRRAPDSRGSALAQINFSWSLGALLSPLLAAWLTPRVPLRLLLVGFVVVLFAGALCLAYESRDAQPECKSSLDVEHPGKSFPRTILLYFVALLCLYGGLETCFSAWLTTVAQRFGQASLVLSDYTLVLLLAGLTAGRAAASGLLLRVGERKMASLALALSAALAAMLAASHRASTIAALAVLLGVALAPVFPSLFANLLSYGPPARTASMVLSASALGAASLPWLMGVVSTRTGSLGTALLLPISTAIVMLFLTLLPLRRAAAAQ